MPSASAARRPASCPRWARSAMRTTMRWRRASLPRSSVKYSTAGASRATWKRRWRSLIGWRAGTIPIGVTHRWGIGLRSTMSAWRCSAGCPAMRPQTSQLSLAGQWHGRGSFEISAYRACNAVEFSQVAEKTEELRPRRIRDRKLSTHCRQRLLSGLRPARLRDRFAAERRRLDRNTIQDEESHETTTRPLKRGSSNTARSPRVLRTLFHAYACRIYAALFRASTGL